MQIEIDYFMSPMSPWTYLGHGYLREIAARHNAQVRVKPIDVGSRVFPVSGGLPLAKRAPQRQSYRLVELRRWAELRGVALELHPKHFPVPAEDACRLIIAARLEHDDDAAMRLADAMMRAVWVEQRDISDTATLHEIIHACAMDVQALAHRVPDAHQVFDSYTQEAIDRGVFGVPWYVFRDEPFWGQDRLDLLDHALERARAARQ
ncbi:MAG: 2-hydroxychromene-2-carboxylate isomerase [Burkholderiaceae bacterium]|nr:2-hydroxychromene-2-carboxylate isomerase [Burkholderiaceae bacterium]